METPTSVNGTFIPSRSLVIDTFDWGRIAWTCRPANTESTQMAVLDVTINVGGGHDFHRHPDQEETIYLLSGTIEQWIETEKRLLRPGDAVFIKRGVVHASFQRGDAPAHLLAILGPSVGPGGYEMEDCSAIAPWSGIDRS